MFTHFCSCGHLQEPSVYPAVSDWHREHFICHNHLNMACFIASGQDRREECRHSNKQMNTFVCAALCFCDMSVLHLHQVHWACRGFPALWDPSVWLEFSLRICVPTFGQNLTSVLAFVLPHDEVFTLVSNSVWSIPSPVSRSLMEAHKQFRMVCTIASG